MSALSDPMLIRAAQLMRAPPYVTNKSIDEDIITKAAISQAIVEQTHPDVIAAAPFIDRYTLIRQIQEGILATHPAPDHLPYKPINEALIKDKIAAIAKVSNTLRLSNTYTNLMLGASQQTAQDIADRVAAIKRLLQWGRYQESHKVGYCTDFHAQFMGHLRKEFKAISLNSAFVNAAYPIDIHPKIMEPSISRDGKEAHFIYGWALTHISAPVAAYQIFLNTHPDAMLGTPEDATELTAHESSHIGEGILAHFYEQDPNIIPSELQVDAALLHAMNEKDAYISPRLPSIYATQACELVALAVGQAARDIIENALNQAVIEGMSVLVSSTEHGNQRQEAEALRQCQPTPPALS